MTTLLTPFATTSPTGLRIGSQQPRICNVPPFVRSYGREVVDFMDQIGRPLDPWQGLIMDGAHGIRADSLWSAFETVIDLARQNGKGGATEGIELAGVFLFREPLILHSAHQFKTSTAAFRRLIDIVDASDWLTRRVKMVSRSKGDESIELTKAAGGGRIQFVARTLGSGRGLTGSTTVFDEAAWLTIGQYAAQTPALATIPNPRIIYTSTPPDEDVGPMPEEAMLPSVRSRGLRGGGRTAMYEWSPPEKFDRTDRRVWYDCNPALGIRISEEFLANQMLAFTEAGKPEKFDTEHLGVWPKGAAEQWQVMPEAEWTAALADVDARPSSPLAFSLEMSRDRQTACVAVASRVKGKKRSPLRLVQVEMMAPADVVEWMKTETKARKPCAVLVDPGGRAASLIPDIEAAGIEVLKPSLRDLAAACGLMHDGVAGKIADPKDAVKVRYVRHRGQGPLTAAVAGLVPRKAAESEVWERAELGYVALAAAEALWALAKKGPDDGRAVDNIW